MLHSYILWDLLFHLTLQAHTPHTHSICHRWHLYQSREQLGTWVSRGNWPLVVITSSVSTYLPLSLMTPALVTVCRHPPLLAPSVDVPVTSPYVCVFWMLLPPSIWRVVRLGDEVIMTSSVTYGWYVLAFRDNPKRRLKGFLYLGEIKSLLEMLSGRTVRCAKLVQRN